MNNLIRTTFEKGEGIFQMVPDFVPVKFGIPGHRLKIHPDDYLTYGADSGTIMERWICSISGARSKNPKRPAIAWNDPSLGIDWRLAPEDVVLSPKDSRHQMCIRDRI